MIQSRERNEDSPLICAFLFAYKEVHWVREVHVLPDILHCLAALGIMAAAHKQTIRTEREQNMPSPSQFLNSKCNQ